MTSHARSHHLDAEDEGTHEDADCEGGGCGTEADDAPVGLHVSRPASRSEKADNGKHQSAMTTKSIGNIADDEGTYGGGARGFEGAGCGVVGRGKYEDTNERVMPGTDG